MFDFLKQLTHNHAPPESESPHLQEPEPYLINSSSASEDQKKSLSPNGQLKAVILERKPTKKEVKEQKKQKNSVSLTAKMQQGVKVQLDPEIQAKLVSLVQESQLTLSSLLKTNIHKIKQDIEKKVYIREMSRCEDEYLEEVSNAIKFQNYFINQGIQSTITGVIDEITNDIENKKLQPRLKRKRFLQNGEERKLVALKIIKMQESQLQEKIGELRVELRQQDILERRAKEITDKDQYDTQNIKTKLAEEFVKELQKEKQEKRLKMEEMKERKREIEIQIREEQKNNEEKAKEDRHLKLMEQFIEKQKAKQERQEIARAEQLNFQSFLKEYKAYKPLYKKKEQEFEKAQKQEKKQRFQILKQNQGKYVPLDIDTLDVHEEKYIELRKEDRQRKSAELTLAKHQEKMRKKQLDQKVYKGRFRYLILQEMVEAQIKKKQKEDQKKAILAKKQAYSLQVKERFKPEIDPSKRIQIEEIINSHKGRKRKYMTPNRVSYSQRNSTIGSRPVLSDTGSQPDPKQEGKKYHRLFKQYLKDKIEKGEIRQTNQKIVQTIQPKPPNYLQELRQKYSDRIPSKSARLDHDIEKLKEGDDYRVLMIRAEEFDNKAKLIQKKIRYAPHKPEEEAQLQEEYLCAIKAKMELMSHID